MRLTTKGRFAVTALLDLAMQRSSGPVKLAEISKRQQISLSYLEQLFGKLRQRKLVESVRGPGGGANGLLVILRVSFLNLLFKLFHLFWA